MLLLWVLINSENLNFERMLLTFVATEDEVMKNEKRTNRNPMDEDDNCFRNEQPTMTLSGYCDVICERKKKKTL